MESILDKLAVSVGKINTYGLAFFFASGLIFSACGEEKIDKHDHGHEEHEGHEDKHHHEEGHEELIHLSKKQRNQIKLAIGFPEMRSLTGALELSGTLQVAPQNEAAVTSMVGATVKSIHVIEGDQVKKGQVLAYLHHPDLIELQTNFLKAGHQLKQDESIHLRNKGLFAKEAKSEKEYLASEKDYLNSKTHLQGLEAKLRMIGLDPNAIKKNGIMQQVPVKSPLDGYIHKVTVKTGQYVQADKSLFEVFNKKHMHADFMVFEKDIHLVKDNQKIRFTTASLPGKSYECQVYSVGKAFEENPKAIHIHADILNKSEQLLPGMYVKGHILSEGEQSLTVPNEALVLEGEDYHLFALTDSSDEWKFKPVKVKVIEQGTSYSTIEDPGLKVLGYAFTEAYTLMSELKKGEGGHHHH